MARCFHIAGEGFCISQLSQTETSVILLLTISLIAGYWMRHRDS